MTGRERAPVVPPLDWSPTIQQKILTYAKRRRDGGGEVWFNFLSIHAALHDTGVTADALREALRALCAAGSLRRDPGPQELGSGRQPDRWRA